MTPRPASPDAATGTRTREGHYEGSVIFKTCLVLAGVTLSHGQAATTRQSDPSKSRLLGEHNHSQMALKRMTMVGHLHQFVRVIPVCIHIEKNRPWKIVARYEIKIVE